MNIKSVHTYIDSHLSGLLSQMFGKINFKNRFRVTKETDELSDDDESVWEVKKGRKAETFSVYFDDEIIFTFTEEDKKGEIEKWFLEGFLDAYKDERIYLHKEVYKIKEAEARLKKRAEKAKKEAQKEKDLKKLPADERVIAEKVLNETT